MLSIFVLYTICISFPALLSQITRNLLASSKGNNILSGVWGPEVGSEGVGRLCAPSCSSGGGSILPLPAPAVVGACLCLVLTWLPPQRLLSCPSSRPWSLDLGPTQMIWVISFEILNFITVTKILFPKEIPSTGSRAQAWTSRSGTAFLPDMAVSALVSWCVAASIHWAALVLYRCFYL